MAHGYGSARSNSAIARAGAEGIRFLPACSAHPPTTYCYLVRNIKELFFLQIPNTIQSRERSRDGGADDVPHISWSTATAIVTSRTAIRTARAGWQLNWLSNDFNANGRIAFGKWQ